MPKKRLGIIMRRSSQQIYNVTIFFIFFMCFYGLWGVQLFGELNHHCVRRGKPYYHLIQTCVPIYVYLWLQKKTHLPKSQIFIILGVRAQDVTKDDLTIPDSHCNPKNRNVSKYGIDGHMTYGHRCPPGFDCIKLSVLGRQQLGFIGFGNFLTSIFSVYTGTMFFIVI